MAGACFPSVSQFPIWDILFPLSALLFSRCKLCLRYTKGNFNENPSRRALVKILRARASEHSCNFCERFEQRPNFASTFKLDETIRYPFITKHWTQSWVKILHKQVCHVLSFASCSAHYLSPTIISKILDTRTHCVAISFFSLWCQI